MPASSRTSPPGPRRPSIRAARVLATGGLRGRGWVWWLSLLWVAMGTGGAAYAFAMTTQTCSDVCADGVIWFPQWNGEPGVIVAVGAVAAVVWILLAIPVLVAGLARFGRTKPRDGIRSWAWVGSWIAGVALMSLALIAAGGWLAGNSPADPTQPRSAWGTPGPVVGWGELPVCAAWLALATVMTWILAGNAPENSGRPARQASL